MGIAGSVAGWHAGIKNIKINGVGKMFERPDTNFNMPETDEVYPTATSETVTPAIAKSIAQDTSNAQAQQLAARQRLRGISSTYLRGAGSGTGGKTNLGQ